MPDTLSAAQARRIALAAQGFGGAAPRRTVGPRRLAGLIDRLGLLQIDSVNVFERSHYLPVFARLGAYDRGVLDRMLLRPGTGYVEYFAHVACFLPVADWPLFGWRMREYRDGHAGGWAGANRPLLEWLQAELGYRGPLAASEIEHEANVRRGPWWGWSDVKRGLEVLFREGVVTTAGRTRFERRYALAEQVLPDAVLGAQVPKDEAFRRLLAGAARASGVGTARDLADYYRLSGSQVTTALRELEDAGELVPVRVTGWERGGRPLAAWRHRDARLPRRTDAAALLSPFDPVVWERARTERMFGFTYRIEIYTPAPQRRYGYYVLPVLVGDELVGRLDLKSDRQAGVLRVRAAWSESGRAEPEADRIAALLASAAAWQGLTGVDVEPRGDFSPALAAAVAASLD